MSQAVRQPEARPPSVPQAAPAAVDRLPERRRFSVEEYYQLAEVGCFQDQRVELIEGDIVVMSPQGPKHPTVIDIASFRLNKAFAGLGYVRSQATYESGPHSRPEPDLAVIKGKPQDYFDRLATPADTLLLVEVSHTTLGYDRGIKQKLYAQAGVAEYWILDLNTDQLETYRDPHEDSAAGWRYRQAATLGFDEQVTLLAAPDHPIPVRELLT
jgi:Uma2 family endonuclease